MVYDVLVAGAGVSGAFIARELARYNLKICMAEKEADVAMGSSKANSGIVHAGYDAEPGSLKALLNVEGNILMERTADELDVHYKKNGSLVLAFDDKDKAVLRELMSKGIKNGVKGLTIITAEKTREMEPNVSGGAVAALYAPYAGIVCPYELTIAAVENAVSNGVELKLNCEVKGISYENDMFTLKTSAGILRCRYLINAAGLFADSLSAMAGDDSFTIIPRKGEYMLFDKSRGKTVSRVIFRTPSDKGKGVLVSPTVDGNLLLGPNAEDITDKGDTSTSKQGIAQIFNEGIMMVPSIKITDVITSYAGLRARPSTGDFIIGPSAYNKRFINVAGIESPGLTAAPAIGRYVAGILRECGLQMEEKNHFNPVREKVLRFRDLRDDEINRAIKDNPLYGHVVCRCEKVTEAEVIDSIRRPAGARNLDAVKRRTRAGMGRCQGGFCMPRIVEILSRELGIPAEAVTKSGGNSRILLHKTK